MGANLPASPAALWHVSSRALRRKRGCFIPLFLTSIVPWHPSGALDPDPDLAACVEESIRTSPCTFVELEREDVLAMAQKYGFDEQARIAKFSQLDRDAKAHFFHAFNKCQLDAKMRPVIIQTCGEISLIPKHEVNKINPLLNSMFQECGLDKEVKMCESVASSYSALVAYKWSTAEILKRMIKGCSELDSLLKHMRFRSLWRDFVSTSLTRSPFLLSRDIEYTIKITETYRKHAVPLRHTAVFECEFPETQNGLKNTSFFEDEVRMENNTPVEANTVDIVFYYDTLPDKATVEDLRSKYAPLGSVDARLKQGPSWGFA